LLEQEDDNSGAAEGKRESGALGAGFEGQGGRGDVVMCYNASKSSECCEYESDLRTTASIQSRMGEGEERHTL
jgi:hypothetical protein